MHFAPGLSFDLLLAAWVDPTHMPEDPAILPALPHQPMVLLEERADTQGAGSRHPASCFQAYV